MTGECNNVDSEAEGSRSHQRQWERHGLQKTGAETVAFMQMAPIRKGNASSERATNWNHTQRFDKWSFVALRRTIHGRYYPARISRWQTDPGPRSYDSTSWREDGGAPSAHEELRGWWRSPQSINGVIPTVAHCVKRRNPFHQGHRMSDKKMLLLYSNIIPRTHPLIPSHSEYMHWL